MSQWILRPIAVPDDYPGVAAILSACSPEPTTVADLQEKDANNKPEREYRLVAVDGHGAIGGFGQVSRYPEDLPGCYTIKASVAPDSRGRGAGSALYSALEAWALEQGAASFKTYLRDNDPRSLAFARRRGFELDRHLFESTLDHYAFDETPFAGVIERVEASGIRFFTMADAPGEQTARKLYDLYSRTVWDIPGIELQTFEPYDEWYKWVCQSRRSRLDLIIIAADGDRFAGCTALTVNEVSGVLWSDYTCVDQAYRGRELALALKLLSIQAARRVGAAHMRTNNDAENAPMLAVNRRLGYVPSTGIYRLKRRCLADEVSIAAP